MPLTLLFDEKYQSHDGFGYARAERWFEHAQAIVFVGTSFSVTVTEEAVRISQRNQAKLFNFNIMVDEKMNERSKNQMYWIIGKAEETLVQLEEALGEEMRRANGRMRLCAW